MFARILVIVGALGILSMVGTNPATQNMPLTSMLLPFVVCFAFVVLGLRAMVKRRHF